MVIHGGIGAMALEIYFWENSGSENLLFWRDARKTIARPGKIQVTPPDKNLAYMTD